VSLLDGSERRTRGRERADSWLKGALGFDEIQTIII